MKYLCIYILPLVLFISACSNKSTEEKRLEAMQRILAQNYSLDSSSLEYVGSRYYSFREGDALFKVESKVSHESFSKITGSSVESLNSNAILVENKIELPDDIYRMKIPSNTIYKFSIGEDTYLLFFWGM